MSPRDIEQMPLDTIAYWHGRAVEFLGKSNAPPVKGAAATVYRQEIDDFIGALRGTK